MATMPGEMESMQEDQAEGGVSICITKAADGTFTVHEMPAMPAEEGAQPAASVDEALQLAGQMLQAETDTPEQQVQAGYDSGKRPMMAGKPNPQAVFGE